MSERGEEAVRRVAEQHCSFDGTGAIRWTKADVMAALLAYGAEAAAEERRAGKEMVQKYRDAIAQIIARCAPGPKGNHHRLSDIFGELLDIQQAVEARGQREDG